MPSAPRDPGYPTFRARRLATCAAGSSRSTVSAHADLGPAPCDVLKVFAEAICYDADVLAIIIGEDRACEGDTRTRVPRAGAPKKPNICYARRSRCMAESKRSLAAFSPFSSRPAIGPRRPDRER